jgi:hypothetical protein
MVACLTHTSGPFHGFAGYADMVASTLLRAHDGKTKTIIGLTRNSVIGTLLQAEIAFLRPRFEKTTKLTGCFHEHTEWRGSSTDLPI